MNWSDWLLFIVPLITCILYVAVGDRLWVPAPEEDAFYYSPNMGRFFHVLYVSGEEEVVITYRILSFLSDEDDELFQESLQEWRKRCRLYNLQKIHENEELTQDL